MQGVISYQNYLKPSGELPKHITHRQYLQLREKPKEYFDSKNMSDKQKSYLSHRDALLIDFAWETGGRIGDLTRIRKEHFDFEGRLLTLDIKKTKRVIELSLSQAMCYDVMRFYNVWNDKEPFAMTPTNAWYICQKYGKMIAISLHPHMFRHGLGLYLLSQGVSINVISRRLGHRSIKTTIDYYLIVTPEIERQILDEIELR